MATAPTNANPGFPRELLDQESGTLLDPPIPFGQYLLRQLVRRSNMSLVVQGTRLDTAAEVVVKICHPEADRDRFAREIKHTRQSEGIPGVIKIDHRDIGRTKEGLPFYATRRIPGVSLGEFIQHPEISRAAKLTVLERLAEIVGAMHRKKTSHRDLKPSNVMVEDGQWVVLLDLGLARAENDLDLTLTNEQAGGTCGYRPPWIARTPRVSRPFEPRWDVYSLGVILVEVLTRVRPDGDHDPNFTPAGARKLIENHLGKDQRFDFLLAQCFANTPEECLPHADAFVRALRDCSRRPENRSSRLKVAALAAAFLLLGAGLLAPPEGIPALDQWLRFSREDPGATLASEEIPPPDVLATTADPPSPIIEAPSKTNLAHPPELELTPPVLGSTNQAPTNSTPQRTIYTVQRGDVLAAIARRTGTTVQALRMANHLETDRLMAGQPLTIPDKAPAAGVTGTWSWTRVLSAPGAGGIEPLKTTLTLNANGEVLTGTIQTSVRDGVELRVTEISNGKVQGDDISFDVKRDFAGNTFTTKYSGKVTGQTITGTKQFVRDGQIRSLDWEATREH